MTISSIKKKSSFLGLAILIGVCLAVVLMAFPFVTYNMEPRFTCLFLSGYLLPGGVCLDLGHIFLLGFCFYCGLFRALCMFWKTAPDQTCILQIFSPIWRHLILFSSRCLFQSRSFIFLSSWSTVYHFFLSWIMPGVSQQKRRELYGSTLAVQAEEQVWSPTPPHMSREMPGALALWH